MIVRTLHEVAGTDREVGGPTFVSRRLLLARDGLGYSLHDTVLTAGTTTSMWYQHHAEAVYCVEGEGSLRNLDDGQVHEIRPGTLYVVDEHERHELTAFTDLRMLCVFTPALTGREVHDEDGTYPLVADAASGTTPQASREVAAP